jgi:hypothetical protein
MSEPSTRATANRFVFPNGTRDSGKNIDVIDTCL